MNVTSIIVATACSFFVLAEVTIFYLIWTGKINLSRLISEPTGDASMSRFQLLVFTFVIGLSLLLVVIGKNGPPQFPKEIPNGILALLGISSGSYLVSKGIQFGSADGSKHEPTTPSTTTTTTTPGGTTMTTTPNPTTTTTETPDSKTLTTSPPKDPKV